MTSAYDLHVRRKIMKLNIIIIPLFLLFLTGCSKKLDGTYAFTPETSREHLKYFSDPEKKAEMSKLADERDAANTVYLEFLGSKVRMGTRVSKKEYEYKMRGDALDIYTTTDENPTILTMKLNEDGDIEYLSTTYRKVD